MQLAQPKNKTKRFDLGELQARHHEIIRLSALGMNMKSVAERTGVTIATVQNTLNSTLGREKMREIQAVADGKVVDFMAEVSEMVGPALEVYKTILDPERTDIDFGLKKKAADTVLLDLAGKGAPKQVQAQHLHAHLGIEQLGELKERGMRAAMAAGIIAEQA